MKRKTQRHLSTELLTVAKKSIGKIYFDLLQTVRLLLTVLQSETPHSVLSISQMFEASQSTLFGIERKISKLNLHVSEINCVKCKTSMLNFYDQVALGKEIQALSLSALRDLGKQNGPEVSVNTPIGAELLTGEDTQLIPDTQL